MYVACNIDEKKNEVVESEVEEEGGRGRDMCARLIHSYLKSAKRKERERNYIREKMQNVYTRNPICRQSTATFNSISRGGIIKLRHGTELIDSI